MIQIHHLYTVLPVHWQHILLPNLCLLSFLCLLIYLWQRPYNQDDEKARHLPLYDDSASRLSRFFKQTPPDQD